MRLAAPPPFPIAIIDYRATVPNELEIVRLLDGAGIPFYLERIPSGGWGKRVVRLFVSVSYGNVGVANAILAAAASSGRLEAVQGMADLISRY